MTQTKDYLIIYFNYGCDEVPLASAVNKIKQNFLEYGVEIDIKPALLSDVILHKKGVKHIKEFMKRSVGVIFYLHNKLLAPQPLSNHKEPLLSDYLNAAWQTKTRIGAIYKDGGGIYAKNKDLPEYLQAVANYIISVDNAELADIVIGKKNDTFTEANGELYGFRKTKKQPQELTLTLPDIVA